MRVPMQAPQTYDADAVHATEPALFALCCLRLDQIVQTLATVLLHALEAETQVHRQIEAKGLVRLKDIQPTKNRTLVIR